MSKNAVNENNIKDNVTNYFKGVKSEWGKITWPERRQVMGEVIVVIAIVIVFTALIFSIDKIFQGLFSLISAN